MKCIYSLGYWRVNDVKPTATGDSQEVKIKVRINNNGLVLISSATMVDKKDLNDAENSNHEQQPEVATEPMDVQEVGSKKN